MALLPTAQASVVDRLGAVVRRRLQPRALPGVPQPPVELQRLGRQRGAVHGGDPPLDLLHCLHRRGPDFDLLCAAGRNQLLLRHLHTSFDSKAEFAERELHALHQRYNSAVRTFVARNPRASLQTASGSPPPLHALPVAHRQEGQGAKQRAHLLCQPLGVPQDGEPEGHTAAREHYQRNDVVEPSEPAKRDGHTAAREHCQRAAVESTQASIGV